MIGIFASGSLKTLTSAKVMVGGVLRPMTRRQVYTEGSLRTVAVFASPLTLSASRSSISGLRTTSPVVSNMTTATPSGGVAPYSYAWTVLSGGAALTSPATAATAVSLALSPGDIESGSIQCTCTDSAGATATITVTYSLYNVGGGEF